jgi:hypothetical protein
MQGAKSVRQLILEQTRRNGDAITTTNARLERIENKFDGADMNVGTGNKLGGLCSDVADLHEAVLGLAANLPGIVRDALRDVLRNGEAK